MQKKRLPGFLCLLLFFFLAGQGFAQSAQELKNSFSYAKKLLDENQFAMARDAFKPLMQESAENVYVQYATYYHSYAAFRAGDTAGAKMSLLQLVSRYPNWEKMDEANYLLATLCFATNAPADAMKYLSVLRNAELRSQAAAAKQHYLPELSPEQLKSLYRSYPADDVVGRTLMNKLYQHEVKGEDAALLKSLEGKYLSAPAPIDKQSMKSSYNVVMLLPLMKNEVDASKTARKNQFVLDLYEGMLIAREKLQKEGTQLNLFVYDTERDDAKIRTLLQNPTLKSADLVIGPLYPANIQPVREFTMANGIPLVNPLSNNQELIGNQSNAFMTEPGFATQARKAAQFAMSHFGEKTAYIFYGGEKHDSIMAYQYKAEVERSGGRVAVFRKVLSNKNGFKVISNDLSALNKESQASIFACLSEPAMAVNLLSAVQSKSLTMTIIALKDWLELQQINYEQLEQANVHFIAPDYINTHHERTKEFDQAYVQKLNMVPSRFAYAGYETLYYFGKMMSKYGVDFEQYVNQQPFLPGQFLPGFYFRGGNDNQFVPICKFVNGELKMVSEMPR